MSGQHGGCHDRNYSDARRFPCSHVLAGIAGPRGHDFDTLVDDDLGKFVRLRVHQHNVDAKRLIGQAAALADVLPQCFGGHAACTDDASAPALEQAAANSPVAMLAMPPCMIGYFVPRISFSSFIFSTFISKQHAAPCKPAAKADAGQLLAGLQQTALAHLMQGQRDAGGACVAVAVDVFVKLGGVGVQLFYAVIKDTAVG